MKFKENFKRFMTLDRHHDAGFTLVELIVVIAILAILAGVAVPVYSGYIAKANKAADWQLVGAINQAYAAACVEKSTAPADGTTLSVQSNQLVIPTGDELWDAFAVYYGDNSSAKFKSVENGTLTYVTAKGGFQLPDDAMVTIRTESGIIVTMKKEDAEKFVESIYGSMDNAILLGKVDLVTDFAANMMDPANPNAAVVQLLQNPKYTQALANSLGITEDITTPEGYAAFEAAIHDLARQKALAMNPDLDRDWVYSEDFINDEMYDQIEAEFTANNAVLFAAQNSAAAADGIIDVLKGSNSKATIAENLLSNDSNDLGLSQAAIAYGLYTAYAQRNNIDTSSLTPTQVLTKLDTDADFKAYINGQPLANGTSTSGQVDSDLAGFMSAMNMIKDNSNNSVLVTDVLLNGFNTDTLDELLSGAKG